MIIVYSFPKRQIFHIYLFINIILRFELRITDQMGRLNIARMNE